MNTLNSLCAVLGMDFKQTIREINPTLDDSNSTNNISTDTIERLSTVISSLREVKIQRMQKVSVVHYTHTFLLQQSVFYLALLTCLLVLQLQDFATTMVELWSLMDTPFEEQKMFQNVTRNIAASENEITEPNTLSLDFIKFVSNNSIFLKKISFLSVF